MQTRFSPEQLARADIRAADAILRSCVHCGFCTATCPTYQIRGDELDGPRGRIYLIKTLLEDSGTGAAAVMTHLDRCLGCLSCMTTCPSGVDYQHLLDIGRAEIERAQVRGRWPRFLRAALAFVVSRPRLLATVVAVGRVFAPWRRWFPGPLGAALALAASPRFRAQTPEARPPTAAGPRVRLLPGCVQQVFGADVNAATVRVLNTCGFATEVLAATPCCGAAEQHLGQTQAALGRAISNTRAWSGRPEAPVVVNASGCGTMLKDYGHLLAATPQATAARVVSASARDIVEVLSEVDLERYLAADRPRLRVAYHAACSLAHGQKVLETPIRLLERLGHTVITLADAHLCCGAAGTYHLFEPVLSAELGRRKAAAIEAVEADVVASGNLGCMLQLARFTQRPLLHTVQLVDWACGGPRPARYAPTATP